MNDDIDLERLKEETKDKIAGALEDFAKDYPDVVEGISALAGGSLGASGSLMALFYGGSVKGLSAAGVTAGLAKAGALVGGGMVAGVGVLAAPVATLAVGGYAIAKRRRNAKKAAAIRTVIEKLHSIQERLTANAEYFREELATIKTYIDHFEHPMP